jgi:2-phosphoglycolate phosphatase
MNLISDTTSINAVLFDLDGTLLDTAPDLASALNATLTKRSLDMLDYPLIRPYVSYGADGLIKLAYGDQLTAEQHQQVKQELISYYQGNIAEQTQLFNSLNTGLEHLEDHNIKWGIVTNKPEYLTTPLLKALQLYERSSCIVCGDEVKQTKPHPESIYMACELISVSPENVVYIGDAERDIQAGNSAGSKTIACEYGYIPDTENIQTWQADAIVEHPQHLSTWLQSLH